MSGCGPEPVSARSESRNMKSAGKTSCRSPWRRRQRKEMERSDRGSSRRTGKSKHLHLPGGVPEVQGPGDALVDREGLDDPSVARPQGVLRPGALPPRPHRHELQGSADDRVSRPNGRPGGRFVCCNALKTQGLQQILDKYGFKGIFLGIRRDEEGSRAKERVFSPRDKNFEGNYKDQPPELWDQFNTSFGPDTHVRIHPLLSWTELDIWEYIRREEIPICPLYLSREGKRFRSLGCVPCNFPIASGASTVNEIIEELKVTKTPERAGRAQDHEAAYMMQKLRSLGYM